MFYEPMHELSIAGSLFDALMGIARENHLKRIYRVTLSVGKMRQIVPAAMDMAFAAVTAGTIAEKAELVIESIPVRMRCASCGTEFAVESNVFLCPECGSARLELLEGQELIIKNIEGED